MVARAKAGDPEALAGALFLSLALRQGPGLGFVVTAAFGLALLVLFFTDLDHQLLPDAITLTGFVTGLAVSWFNPFLVGQGWGRVWASSS